MSPRRIPAATDRTGRRDRPLRITVDGETLHGIEGQTLAGVMLAAGRTAWRTAPSGAPRGVFCGIGVCFDCLVTVGTHGDVRACRRPARDGDEVTTQSRASADAGAGEDVGPGSGGGAGPAPAWDADSDADSQAGEDV